MITSRISSKAQTTIPRAVRAALGIGEGDVLEYQIEDGRVVVTKAKDQGLRYDPFATFDEWNSEADRKAYADL